MLLLTRYQYIPGLTKAWQHSFSERLSVLMGGLRQDMMEVYVDVKHANKATYMTVGVDQVPELTLR